MSDDKLVKKCRDIVRQSAGEIVSVQGMKGFLDVAASFPFLSRDNQVLVWKQKPDATLLHGAKAWEKLGRTVRQGEPKVALLLPQVLMTQPGEYERDEDGTVRVDANNNDVPVYKKYPTYTGSFRVVPVYDLSQTEGADIPENETDYNFETGIKKHGKGLSIEEVPASDMGSDKYSVDVPDPSEEAGTVMLLDSLSGKERDRELINAYCDRFIRYWKTTPKNAKELLFATQYIVQKRLLGESKQRMFGIMKDLEAKGDTEKLSFLSDVSLFSARFIEELTDRGMLTFPQTSFVNCILDTGEKGETTTLFTAMRYLDRDISAEYRTFCNKIQSAKPEGLKALYDKKLAMELFFEPPFELLSDE